MRRGLLSLPALVGAGLAAGILSPSNSLAHLNNGYWWAAGHTLQQGQNSNMVGMWQNIGYLQGCPAPIDGIFGPATVAQTKRMQSELPTPGQGLPQTGIVDATTWDHVQNAWVYTPGTPANFMRLNPIQGQPWLGLGQYTYYGGFDNTVLSWIAHPNGGHMWKFQPRNTTTWEWASSSRTMGSTPNPC